MLTWQQQRKGRAAGRRGGEERGGPGGGVIGREVPEVEGSQEPGGREELGEESEEEHAIQGVYEAMYKKSDTHRLFHVLWGNGDDTWEPERGTQVGNPNVGINPSHLYGPCFDTNAGMKDRRIVFKFASGTMSNLRADENKDAEGRRKAMLVCECIVREVREEDVLVAWEEYGVPEDAWAQDPQPLQLHTLEIGTEWKLLTYTGIRGGEQVMFQRGLQVSRSGRKRTR
jgi:hypothetical protein